MIVFAYIKCLLDFGLFFLFTGLFLEARKNWVLNIVMIVALSVILFGVNTLHRAFLNTVVSILLATLFSFVVFKGDWYKKLICSGVEVAIIVFLEFVPITISSMYFDKSILVQMNITIRDAGFNLISTGIFCILVLSVRFVMQRLRKRYDKLSITSNHAVILVPIISINVVYYILFITSFFPSDEQTLGSLVIFCLLIVMNVVVVIGDSSLEKRFQLRNKLENLYNQEKANLITISQQNQHIGELQSLAHDFKNQVDGIKKLIQSGEAKQVDETTERYVDDLLASINSRHKYSSIPTPPLRVIISQAQISCLENDISLQTNIEYGDFDFLPFTDIYSLFDNAIENAIQACKGIEYRENRWIHVLISRKRRLTYIEISNSKSNEIIEKNGRFSSTKPSPHRHGIGIQNIKRVVKKNGGQICIDHTPTSFTVSITLPIE